MLSMRGFLLSVLLYFYIFILFYCICPRFLAKRKENALNSYYDRLTKTDKVLYIEDGLYTEAYYV